VTVIEYYPDGFQAVERHLLMTLGCRC